LQQSPFGDIFPCMLPKKRITTETFDCPKCERRVTFTLILNEFSTEETGVFRVNVDKIENYGQCKLAQEAKIPNHPVISDVQDCPIYQELDKR
jgi:hypothetical protein